MARIPTKEEILEWISENPAKTGKRDIARAFGIKGSDRIDLKRLLKELEADGQLAKRRRTYRDPDQLPPVSVIEVSATTPDGELLARPMEWKGEGDEPKILLVTRASDPALGAGDRVLARLAAVRGEDHDYEGRVIRRIAASPKKILGVYRGSSEGGRIVPIDKGVDREWRVPADMAREARDGELVEAEQAGPKDRMGLPKARVVARLGDPGAPKAVSLIAIHQHGIPDAFPAEVLAEAEAVEPVSDEGREDLTDLPFVTIDPADARDRDDAVLAIPDEYPANEGGFVVWVAIADVAAFARPGTALDREARRRGNSTYFPDRVVPMLPDRLSGDLCSLHEDVPRAVVAVRMRIDATGEKIGQTFHRAVIRSRASLTYQEFQAAADGDPSERMSDLTEHVVGPLTAAHAALERARQRRQPLDLDLPERRIILSEAGEVLSVAFKERLDAHRLIEEFMVLANVAAAETLIDRRQPQLFRVHEEPESEKLEALRETAQSAGLVLAKGQVLRPAHLNRLLSQADGTDFDAMINMATLRSMTQAYYTPENLGHFGLALRAYAHFTSPIRRYADLVVHRALIAAHGWVRDELPMEQADDLRATGEHISNTERRSMTAERDTTDRYLAAYLSERVGTEMQGRISGVQRFGAFVRLDETGADGLIPVRSISDEFFHFDRAAHTLMGAESGTTIEVGQRVLVRLTEATPVTGGLMLELLELEGERVASSGRGRSRRRPVKRRGRKAAKAKRKVVRKARK